jgi:hypothetical protein
MDELLNILLAARDTVRLQTIDVRVTVELII